MYYSIITYIDQNVKGYSRQMGGYIRAEKAAVVYGGLAYLGLRFLSEIFSRKKNSPENLTPEGECYQYYFQSQLILLRGFLARGPGGPRKNFPSRILSDGLI